LAVIDRFETQTVNRSEVVEEALRRYLKVVDAAGCFIQRKAKISTEKRRKSNFDACHFSIDPGVANQLNEIAQRRGWVKADLIRQAILTLGEQVEALAG
jgi:hypothetical protein